MDNTTEQRIEELEGYINMKLDMATGLGAVKPSAEDWMIIKELIYALEIITGDKYTVKNNKLDEV